MTFFLNVQIFIEKINLEHLSRFLYYLISQRKYLTGRSQIQVSRHLQRLMLRGPLCPGLPYEWHHLGGRDLFVLWGLSIKLKESFIFCLLLKWSARLWFYLFYLERWGFYFWDFFLFPCFWCIVHVLFYFFKCCALR